MNEDYFITGKVSPLKAFELFERLAKDGDKQKPLHVSGEDFKSISIFYHAAKYHGFTVTHFRVGYDKYPIKNEIIRIAEGDWQYFIEGSENRDRKAMSKAEFNFPYY